MIYKNGDLLSTNFPMIMHVGNNKGVMGAGVAKAIYTKYPEVRMDYLNNVTQHLGTAVITCVKPDVLPYHSILFERNAIEPFLETVVVCTLIAQDGYGKNSDVRYLNYHALSLAIDDALDQCECEKYQNTIKIAIPMMGAGLAGGNWEIIEQILMDVEAMYGGTLEFVVYKQI